jgi:hypothetical protein
MNTTLPTLFVCLSLCACTASAVPDDETSSQELASAGAGDELRRVARDFPAKAVHGAPTDGHDGVTLLPDHEVEGAIKGRAKLPDTPTEPR